MSEKDRSRPRNFREEINSFLSPTRRKKQVADALPDVLPSVDLSAQQARSEDFQSGPKKVVKLPLPSEEFCRNISDGYDYSPYIEVIKKD